MRTNPHFVVYADRPGNVASPARRSNRMSLRRYHGSGGDQDVTADDDSTATTDDHIFPYIDPTAKGDAFRMADHERHSQANRVPQ